LRCRELFFIGHHHDFIVENFLRGFELCIPTVILFTYRHTCNDICGLSGINSVVFRVHPVGVTQISFTGANIQVTPNPNNGNFTVKGTIGTATEDVTVELTNMLGQTVYKNNVTAVDGVLNEQITTNNSLAEGIYILGVHTTAGNGTFRIVVEK